MAAADAAIPTVTVDDLRDFHATHFPHTPAPDHILHALNEEPVEEYYVEEEHALGYYEDGKPRTLTDEQIAMFRHSEIQAVVRKRRLERETGNASEGGAEEREAEESIAEGLSRDESPGTQTTLTGADKVTSGRVDKLKSESQQWTMSSPRTKARNKRNRDKYKAKRRDERVKREQTRKHNRTNDSGSDEWDPWHQAKGPDVQKDDTVDLEY